MDYHKVPTGLLMVFASLFLKIENVKTEIVIGIMISECDTNTYRHYQLTETDDTIGNITYIGNTEVYDIMIRANHLTKEGHEVLILNTDSNGTFQNILYQSPGFRYNRALVSDNLDIYVCENKCYYTDPMICLGKDYYCEDFDIVTKLSVSVINHLSWKTVVIIYDTATTLLLNSLHNALADEDVFVLSYNYDDMRTTNEIEGFIGEIYRKLFMDGVNITLICGNECIKTILKQADTFDTLKDNYRRTSLKQRTCWLLVTDCSWEIRHMLLNISQLDNIAVLDLSVSSKQNRRYKKNLFTEIMTAVNTYARNISEFTSNISNDYQNIKVFNQSLVSDGDQSHVLFTLLWGINSRKIASVGQVHSHGKLLVTNKLFPNLLYGFNGKEFVVTTTRWPPFVDKVYENGTLKYFGFCLDLLDELARQLNFTYRLVEPPDNEFGRIRKNGTWTGMIGQLEMREVDMMMAPASVQASREMAMDFTYPFYFDTSNFLIKKPDPDAQKWRVYIDPFHWQVYICIAFALPVCAGILYLVEIYNPFFRESTESPHNYQYGFWYMFGALLTQGGENPPVAQSSRALISFWWIFSLVIVATYSGNLIAFLTISKEKLPLTSLEEVGSQSEYKWGTLGGSYFITLFEHSTLPSFKKIWAGLQHMNQTDTAVLDPEPDIHIAKVRSEKYIYIGDKISMEARVSNDCTLVISKEEFPNMNYGVGFPNNSLHTELFSNTILELLESGIFQIWKQKHWPVKTHCKAESTAEAKKIRFIDVQSAFYLIASGITLGFIVLLSECLFKKAKDLHKMRTKTMARRKNTR